MNETERKERLIKSKRQLTKLLIIASEIKYKVTNNEIELGNVEQSEKEEAANLLKHGSPHIPKILINSSHIEGFEHFVVAWQSISIVTGVLDVISEMEIGTVLVGLPDGIDLLCIVTPSVIQSKFDALMLENSAKDHCI